jgi:plasmid maintenance system antidote protein VapI
MKNRVHIQEKILNQPSYWVEGINSFLYTAIIEYMEKHNINKTELATHLGISKGRVSQILNDGEINFSIEKIVQIALKVDKFPLFELKDKRDYINNLQAVKRNFQVISNYERDHFSEVTTTPTTKSRIIPLYSTTEFKQQLAL